MTKKILVPLALTLGLLAPGCLGPNNAFNGINNWNAEATGSDIVNEAIFIGMWIIPVYEIVWLGDVVIFNTIGYWGKNPIAPAEPFPETFKNGGGE